MAEQMENLIDLGKYPQNDVELISREFNRVLYLQTLEDYAKEMQKESPDKNLQSNMEEVLKALEVVIVLLDGNEDFLEFIHKDSTDQVNDDEFDRF